MWVLGIDPSGNFKEGAGTTGFVLLNELGEPVDHWPVKASKYLSRLEYWDAVTASIFTAEERAKEAGHPLVVAMEDYYLYAHKAHCQINSELETPRLLGILEYMLWKNNIKVLLRNASVAKNRWPDKILIFKGYLTVSGTKTGHLCAGKVINHHAKDALRHAVHCYYFELKKEEK